MKLMWSNISKSGERLYRFSLFIQIMQTADREVHQQNLFFYHRNFRILGPALMQEPDVRDASDQSGASDDSEGH